MNIGDNIKYLRTAAGLTQEQLANSLGVSFQAISKWETNSNMPDIQLLPQIAQLFGISIVGWDWKENYEDTYSIL